MKILKIVVPVVVTGIVLASCKKYEEIPANTFTEEYVFDSLDQNGTYAQQVVNNIYSYLNHGFNRIDNVVLGAATDDAIPSEVGNSIEVLSKGRLTANNNVDDSWGGSYTCIRKVNNFLAKQHVVPRDATTKQYWRAEVRFMRAFSYFELIKRYGGVPLLGDHVYNLDEAITISRSSFEECVNYIVGECDIIKDSLRNESIGSQFPNTEWGKITRSAAMTLKARTLLYAASPLNNPTNNLAKWQAAADAAKAVMNLGYHHLNGSFSGVFSTRKNSEIILAYQRSNTTDLETINAPVGYGAPTLSFGYVSPTQNLVDSFPMINGLSIYAAGSTYDPANPYANRDPRMNWTVFYNGSQWLNRDVETFEGGMDKPGGLQTQTRTGYYMRKFLGNFSTSSSFSSQTHNFPIFRYAEILLNYAEAINETGDQAEALIQLRALRQRAGITAGVGSTYGLPAGMSQAQMRDAIHRERRLELAFEEHRYWDLRRWKTADVVLNTDAKGMRILQTSPGVFSYQVFNADKLSFDAGRMYLYPIPFNEILANPSLQQNPGY